MKLKTQMLPPEALLLWLEATRRSGLRVISCQAGKLLERKDTHKTPLPQNSVADVIMYSIIILLILLHKALGKIPLYYYRK